MQQEGINPNNFVIRAIPDLSSEGLMRPVRTKIKNLKISDLENDDLNEGMKKVKMEFSLSKGSYATEAIKSLFN